MNWRRVAGMFFVSLALTSATSLRADFPGPNGEPSVSVIDIHTHVFNAHDLPLRGILNSHGAPWIVAVDLETLLNAWTKDDLGECPPQFVRSADNLATVAESIRANFEAHDARLVGKSLFLPLSKTEQTELISYADNGTTSGDLERLAPGQRDEQQVRIVAEAMRMANFPPSEGRANVKSADLDGYIRFLKIITSREVCIAQYLQSEEYQEVDLFVHHMMDMDKAYDSHSKIPFKEQMRRMATLDREFKGKFVHFVAFDPFRQDDAVATVERGRKLGAIGVKFYAPSGYTATANDIRAEPSFFERGRRERWESRYEDLGDSQKHRNERLNKLTEALFAYCKENDMPILAHCMPGEMQADTGYGWMSDPRYWEQALKNHPDLRVCFAHAGGDAYWFPDPKPEDPKEEAAREAFGAKVIDLCLTYPNVYCDVAYFAKVLQPQADSSFRDRLVHELNRHSHKGDWYFGDKIMYGTDWHMLHKEKNHDHYLQAFRDLFADPPLQQWQRAFFARNAIEYLKLDKLVTDQRFAPKQQECWRDLVERAKAGPK